MSAFRFAPVTAENRDDFEKLFEAPGAPKYCWCMAWRPLPGGSRERQSKSSADRKEVMMGLIQGGTPVGLLAYQGEEPIGWCSVAPRETFLKLSPDQNAAETNTWSITCFYVPRSRRRSGLAGALLDAAIRHAFNQGAEAVEAYPVDPDSPSYRFMGFHEMYARRGFRETGLAGTRRHVVRLERA
jgi:GNAT superfamily N-acetyltransferase